MCIRAAAHWIGPLSVVCPVVVSTRMDVCRPSWLPWQRGHRCGCVRCNSAEQATRAVFIVSTPLLPACALPSTHSHPHSHTHALTPLTLHSHTTCDPLP